MNDLNRREFLGAAPLLAVGLTSPVLARDDKNVSANEKVVVALVGCGGMGRADLKDFMRLADFEVAAVCDVDSRRTKDALNDGRRAGRSPDKVQVEKDF